MIQIAAGLVITADDSQYILGRPVKKRDGKIAVRSPRYYTNLSQAVRAAAVIAVRKKVAIEEITTLRDCINEMERIQREFEKLIEPLNMVDYCKD